MSLWSGDQLLSGFSLEFLISGRKIPRDGGSIVAVGKSRVHIQTIVEEDDRMTSIAGSQLVGVIGVCLLVVALP